VIELGEDVTFSDPVGWPRSPARPTPSPDNDTSDYEAGLPPLPTLEPLPRLKPLDPMPQLPWDDEPAPSRPVAPPPPANHPAAGSPSHYAPPAPTPAVSYVPPSMTLPVDAPLPKPTVEIPAVSPSVDAPAQAPSLPEAQHAAPTRPFAEPASAEHFVTAAPAGGEVAAARPAAAAFPAGRHSSAPSPAQNEALPYAPGRRVLVVGGAEPLGGMVAERLIAAGHRIAVQGVTIPAELPPSIEVEGEPYRAFEPIPLAGDRSDSEDMVHTVARAEVALGGLDALVLLPAQQTSGIGLDADASTWSDEWSSALTTEVLAAACATHIAARSFLARRKAGRIVLVTDGRDGAQSGAMPASATRAALSRLGADLTRELSPHGIGVSVVSTGTGGTQDFAVAQVADVVEVLLSTPVLTGVSSQIG
jgi:NAD(P)-dependent dehydrogenase (short-subunit alcohol dehydrogenase family)